MEKVKEDLDRHGEIFLKIKVVPKSPKTEFVGKMEDDETWKIRVRATPEKGKANEELRAFLRKEFAVSKECVTILSGAHDRIKLVKIKKG